MSIKRLVINLVNNAKRYGKAPIYLSATVVPTFIETAEIEDSDVVTENEVNKEAKEQLVICVRDCGDGVAEDQLERVMQPFERGESARTTQGSGLGLAIVDRIARLHHGKVEAINHPDGGLQVCVRIPLISKVAGEPPLDVENDKSSISDDNINNL
jgi:two-component system osmolarity sensor histidine kinase EnvZ